ncbi:MAG: hypothetical protein KAR13_21675 [Desulfobulbaceae bacterium]|nr:hypothetical protein [Desulfobulbaceae bacterium]
MPQTSSQSFREPGEAIIRVDGVEITDFYSSISEVRVEMTRGAAAVCTITFDTIRTENGAWTIQDSGILVPWKKISIKAAFASYTEEVMRGYIREIQVDCPQNMGAAKVVVTGQDESILLDRDHVRQVMSTEENPVTDGDMITGIAQDNGLETQVETGLDNQSLNLDGTFIRLLADRAEANGFEWFVREGMLHFHPPDLESEPQETIRVYAGPQTNCLRFSLQHEGHLPDQVSVTRAADTGTSIEEETFSSNLALLGATAANSEDAGLTPFVWRMEQPLGTTQEEARARAQAKANENAWKIKAAGELDGALYGHVLLNNATVAVDGVGETYDGIYYVDEVKHLFTATGYRQEFRLLRNATGESL